MAKVGDEVVLRGTVTKVGCDTRLVVQGTMSWWLPDSVLTCVVPAPVTVKCDKCGIEHPLTDLSFEQRCAWIDSVCPERRMTHFLELLNIHEMLERAGMTFEQFVAGL